MNALLCRSIFMHYKVIWYCWTFNVVPYLAMQPICCYIFRMLFPCHTLFHISISIHLTKTLSKTKNEMRDQFFSLTKLFFDADACFTWKVASVVTSWPLVYTWCTACFNTQVGESVCCSQSAATNIEGANEQ